MKPFFKIIDAGIYPFDILYTYASSKEEIKKYLKEKYKYVVTESDDESLTFGSNLGRTVRLDNNAFILWQKQESFYNLAHEIFHLTEMIMELIQTTPLNQDTSEPYAYLHEYLWRQILPPQKK